MARRDRTATRRFGSGDPIDVIGLPARPFTDLYHFLLTSSWPQLIVLLLAGFFAVNLVFAVGYLAIGGIENARPGSFFDAFFFSIQTIATVGYGRMSPVSLAAHLLSTVEITMGLLALALVTGLVFSKFSRPTARVLFSRVAVVGSFDGVPSLMFRMANARASQIVEAHVTVVLVRREWTREGSEVRRVHDLVLRRSTNALFALTWTAIHPITPDSPLAGADTASLAATESAIIVSLAGFDEELAQTVHARYGYRSEEVRFGHDFVDVLGQREDGRRIIDLRRFHDTAPPGQLRAESPGAPPEVRAHGGADRVAPR